MRPIPRRSALAALAFVVCLPAAAHAGAPLRTEAGPYRLEVLVHGSPARSFAYGGETWVLGHLGDRYTLRVVNRSGRRIEAVVSVDGRDVIAGKPGDFRARRGYLVPAWGSVDIDGWRMSQAEAAAFRFSSVDASYAARTGGGRDVGVIGVAVFPERLVPPALPRPIYVPPPYEEHEPWGRGPRADDKRKEGYAGREEGDSDAPAASAPPTAARGSREGHAHAGAPSTRRRGLGTEFGEAVQSRVEEVEFVRADRDRPTVILGARYNDHDGLVAIGIPVDPPPYSEERVRETAEPFPVSDRRYATPPPGWSR